jgi:predicted nucleic acid-binding protein
MRKPTLYLETSVVSYLVARPADNLVIAARQWHTQGWWNQHRRRFRIFVSRFVWDESSQGDAEMVRRRLRVVKPLPWLPITNPVARLAAALVGKGPLPARAQVDAMHIALAAVHGIQFLATWNLTHINNPAMADELRAICQANDFHCPVICTPEELMVI